MNILTDKLIRIRKKDGSVENCSLPEIYCQMALDQISDFPSLQPHQRHSWHAFLAQLAVIAIHNCEERIQPNSVSEWLEMLRKLTSDHPEDSPWELVVENDEIAAFMQCPIPGGLLNPGIKATPDDLDVLVTSKNHDLKQSIAANNNPEDWIFALINLQTMAGFLGAGNYGIARMNGGFSARPSLGLSPAEGGAGRHLFFDIHRMLANRDALLDSYPQYFQPRKGIALIWLEDWNGTDQISLDRLDPYFIEICRLVRLRQEKGIISAFTAPTKYQRIHAKEANGNLGDFWTPINIDENKSFSVSEDGFTYKRIVDLVLDGKKYQLPHSMNVEGNNSNRWRLVARSIAGGQGKTEGFHERIDISISGRTARSFFRQSHRESLAEIAKALIQEITEVSNALTFSIAIAASGGKESDELSKSDRNFAYRFDKQLNEFADSWYFHVLEKRFNASNGVKAAELRAKFICKLIRQAEFLLGEAIESAPCTSIQRFRSRTKSTSAFWNYLRNPNRVFSDQPEIFEILKNGEREQSSNA